MVSIVERFYRFIDKFKGKSELIESGLLKSVALDETVTLEDEVDTRGSPRYDICGPHGEKVVLPPR